MSARSDWCNHAQHDACRYPKCGCACHAFASWTPLPVSNVTPIAKATAAHADSWANREESTWIDKL